MKPLIAQAELRQARYERACWWLTREIAVVPLKPGTKHLQPGYGSGHAHITEVARAAQWFLNTDANLGLVLGGPAGLAVADWDDCQTYQTWINATGTRVETLTEQTSRGYHSFFLAKGLPSVAGQGCEFKTRGVCMVAPSLHPSGVVYQIVNPAPLMSLDEASMQTLFPFLSEILRARTGGKHVPLIQPLKEKEDRSVSGGVVARIKAARSIVAEMRAAGLQLHPAGSTVLIGLCPFHQDHTPSLWVNPESGLWGCNKPTCPAAGIHDVINFRALAQNISNRAAIQQMAKEFLTPNLR